jgi:hypothetical protein
MANLDAPRGFTPVMLKDSDVHMYYKAAAVILGVGDPVIRVTNSSDPLGYSMVTRATTGAAITGVVVAILPSVGRTTKHLASADTGYVLVADNPSQLFKVQDNGGATGLIVTQIGEHIDSVAALNANTTTGRSNYELDTEAVATGNTWRVESKDNAPGNVVGANCVWIVKPNLHTEANASATNITEV